MPDMRSSAEIIRDMLDRGILSSRLASVEDMREIVRREDARKPKRRLVIAPDDARIAKEGLKKLGFS